MIYFVCAALILLTVYMYFNTSRILKSLDNMLDNALDGTFSENEFDETRLSRIEGKMHRCLSAFKVSREKLETERNGIKALVSDISHQTKTPVSNILLYTDLLREKELDRESAALLSNIHAQGEKLSFLISSLVKISRLESGIISLSPKAAPLSDLFAALDFSGAAKVKNITLAVAPPPPLFAVFDLKWTVEALSNIVDNAIKYTPSGGNVTISASEYEMFVKIDVRDTGRGIDEEESSKIFSRFYRSPKNSNVEGVGLGLYLSREIISREGGYIKLTSKAGEGSVFSIFLPKAANLSEP